MSMLRQFPSARRGFLLLCLVALGAFALSRGERQTASADQPNSNDATPSRGSSANNLDIKHGDHICLIGNTLADRMQHDGWLETYLYARFRDADLVVRDLGFSGDEIEGGKRLRSAGFGSPDQHLEFSKADVIFAFFGYNESFAGTEGLEKFKRDLDAFLKHTLSQKYNGKSAPRVVLFSPIAHENLHSRNLPDGSENNARLKLYTAAMADVAKANGVTFVDLFDADAQALFGSEQTADDQRRAFE